MNRKTFLASLIGLFTAPFIVKEKPKNAILQVPDEMSQYKMSGDVRVTDITTKSMDGFKFEIKWDELETPGPIPITRFHSLTKRTQ